jgi:hypothetical protein
MVNTIAIASIPNVNGRHGSLPMIHPPRFRCDAYAITALSECEKEYTQKYPEAEINILSWGLSATVAELSDRLNASGLDDSVRLLLSNSNIYLALIQQAVSELGGAEQVKTTKDVEGLYRTILRLVGNEPKRFLLARMVADVLNHKRVRITSANRQWERLDNLTLARGIPIRNGQVEPAVDAIVKIIRREGNLPQYVDDYIKKLQSDKGVDSQVFTPNLRQSMVESLQKIGLRITSDADFQDDKYNAYFAVAYHEALTLSTVKDDPIDQFRSGKQPDWDFTVDSFDTTIDTQGVTPKNIKAAGALDYVYTLGELMRVFDVANALVLRWASGALDIPTGETAGSLYRFHKLRNERSTYEERAMLYKRVLNKGNGRLLSNMVANTAFPLLWHKLMVEVTEYIRKSEGKQMGSAFVSRSQIYQAVKNLQHNLTETMTGMAHIQVAEDYAHLQEALNILKADEILNMFGGRRKTLWSVIEQVAREDLGVMVPTAPLRTTAVEGNKIFQWVADFNEGFVQNSGFQSFLSSAEAWIIAQASIETGGAAFNGRRGAGNDDFDDQFDDAGNDDFENW